MTWTLKDFERYDNILLPSEKSRLLIIGEAFAHDNYPTNTYIPNYDIDCDDFWKLHRN